MFRRARACGVHCGKDKRRCVWGGSRSLFSLVEPVCPFPQQGCFGFDGGDLVTNRAMQNNVRSHSLDLCSGYSLGPRSLGFWYLLSSLGRDVDDLSGF